MRRQTLAPLTLLAALAALTSGCVEFRRADEGGGQEQSRPAGNRGGGQGGASRAEPASQSGGSRYQPSEAGAEVHALPGRFAPLTRIVGKGAFPFQSRTSISTVGDACYTPDLQGWLKRHPPNTPLYEATLRHEQIHAQRQAAAGVDPWIDRYLKDRAFMWAEEQRGWYEELRYLRGRGLQVDPAAVARNLSKYSNLRGSMVSQAEAEEWARAVLEGRWQPD